jgi:hypothetical protein
MVQLRDCRGFAPEHVGRPQGDVAMAPSRRFPAMGYAIRLVRFAHNDHYRHASIVDGKRRKGSLGARPRFRRIEIARETSSSAQQRGYLFATRDASPRLNVSLRLTRLQESFGDCVSLYT